MTCIATSEGLNTPNESKKVWVFVSEMLCHHLNAFRGSRASPNPLSTCEAPLNLDIMDGTPRKTVQRKSTYQNALRFIGRYCTRAIHDCEPTVKRSIYYFKEYIYIRLYI